MITGTSKRCPWCNGTGWIPGSEYLCPHCEGTGWQPWADYEGEPTKEGG